MVRFPPGRLPLGLGKFFNGSLSTRLFVGVFGLILLAFTAYAAFNIRFAANQWNHQTQERAQRLTELIQRSTHYSMLLNRKEDVHQIIRSIAAGDQIEGVRVYDKNGVIIFSAREAEIGTRVDLQAEACVSCHRGEQPLHSLPEGSTTRLYTRPEGARILGLIRPIDNAPECSRAPCHAHSPEQSVLGVLDVQISMAEADRGLAMIRDQAVIAAMLTALAAGVFSAAFIVRLVRRPVQELINGVRRVAGGDLTTEIPVRSSNEIGQLAVAFNHMTTDLRQAQQEVKEWSSRLEVSLKEKTAELGQSQRQVAHMDKMASLGKLAATVAHELNNPLAGILNYAKLVDRTFEESGVTLPEKEELRRYLRVIQQEAGRSGMIVRNLLTFARKSGSEFALHSLNDMLERSVMLIRHHLEMSGTQLEMEPAEGDDRLFCDGDQIIQALVALLVNAVEAMPQGGTLNITPRGMQDTIHISIADTGVGIAPGVLQQIFEPFFSSKDDSQGSGLGLAVVYGIIQRHKGMIDVDSRIDHGTRFDITLPRRQQEAVSDANIVPQGKPISAER